MNFRVGQKVVCVNVARRGIGKTTAHHLTKGAVYTIREFGFCPYRKQMGLRFEEITLPVDPVVRQELLFHPRRFRPVVERKTDISIFTKMLTPAPRKRVGAVL